MTDPMDDLRQASADVSGVEVLSPAAAAVAVLDAFDYARDGEYIGREWVVNERAMLAAALRAAASQLTSAKAIDTLRAIADELESNSQSGAN